MARNDNWEGKATGRRMRSPEAGRMTADARSSTPFTGFPAGARATGVPSLFFSEMLPQIDDEAELRVTLYAFYALGRRKGYPRFGTESELRAEAPLLAALGDGADQLALDRLRQGLEKASQRGTLLTLEVEKAGQRERLRVVNTPPGTAAGAGVRSRSPAAGGCAPGARHRAFPPRRPAAGPPGLREGCALRLRRRRVGR